MNINQNPFTRDVSHNTSPRTGKIEYIVIHYVGATGSALANLEYYSQKSTTSGSADYYIDHSGLVYQYNPYIESRYTWAVGKNWFDGKHGAELWGKANNSNCVNIEMCVHNTTVDKSANSRGWYFSKETVDSAVELVKWLMNKHSIDIDHVTTHHHVTGKCCPGVIGWNSASGSEAEWENFKKRLLESEVVYTTWVGHVIRCENDTLSVRCGAGIEFMKLASYPALGQGNQVDVIGEQYSSNGYLWYNVRIAGKHVGWVNAAYIFPDNGSFVGKVYNCTTLNVRQGPGSDFANYKHIPRLGANNLVDVIGSLKGWYRVRIGTDHIGYVSKNYIKNN